MPNTGERIKEVREERGYGVDEFAKLLNISRSSLYRYEGAYEAKDLPISVGIKIAEMFNISLDWLACVSDVKYRNVLSNNDYDSLTEDGKKQVNDFTKFVKTKEGTEK